MLRETDCSFRSGDNQTIGPLVPFCFSMFAVCQRIRNERWKCLPPGVFYEFKTDQRPKEKLVFWEKRGRKRKEEKKKTPVNFEEYVMQCSWLCSQTVRRPSLALPHTHTHTQSLSDLIFFVIHTLTCVLLYKCAHNVSACPSWPQPVDHGSYSLTSWKCCKRCSYFLSFEQRTTKTKWAVNLRPGLQVLLPAVNKRSEGNSGAIQSLSRWMPGSVSHTRLCRAQPGVVGLEGALTQVLWWRCTRGRRCRTQQGGPTVIKLFPSVLFALTLTVRADVSWLSSEGSKNMWNGLVGRKAREGGREGELGGGGEELHGDGATSPAVARKLSVSH